MRSALVLLAVAMLILSACRPMAAPTATVPPVPSETPAPSATPAPTATPTVTPTATPTPIPTLPPEQVGGLEGIPDPKISNPELFDLENPNAPIPLFVNAMRMVGIEVNPEDVVNNLEFEQRTGVNGEQIVIASYTVSDKWGTSYTFAIKAEKEEKGEWVWDFESAARRLAEVQGANLGNNDEAWGLISERYAKINQFGTIYIPEAQFQIPLIGDKNRALNETYNRAKFIIENGGRVLVGPVITHYSKLLNEAAPTIEEMTVEEAENFLRTHAQTVMLYKPENDPNAKPLKDLVDVWVLTNEVNIYQLHPDWTVNPFVEKLGWQRFYEIVFKTAQEIDPDALLVFNDFTNDYPSSLHYLGTQQQNLEILRFLKSKGINHIGVGMQMHVNQSEAHVIATPNQFRSVIQQYQLAGGEPIITEMDLNISTQSYNGSRAFNPGTRYAEQAQIMADIVRTYLEATKNQEHRIISWWGRRDNHSWLEPSLGIRDPAPLLFDSAGRPKPVFFAVVSVLLSEQ
jgi:GH35 family endo-1,4-beta-xylanase